MGYPRVDPTGANRTIRQMIVDIVQTGDPEVCWLAFGRSRSMGYGVVHVDGQMVKQHRYAFALVHGPIPKGYDLNNTVCALLRECINPAHWRCQPRAFLSKPISSRKARKLERSMPLKDRLRMVNQ